HRRCPVDGVEAQPHTLAAPLFGEFEDTAVPEHPVIGDPADAGSRALGGVWHQDLVVESRRTRREVVAPRERPLAIERLPRRPGQRRPRVYARIGAAASRRLRDLVPCPVGGLCHCGGLLWGCRRRSCRIVGRHRYINSCCNTAFTLVVCEQPCQPFVTSGGPARRCHARFTAMNKVYGQRTLALDVTAAGGDDSLDMVLRALASQPRRRILTLLADRLQNVSEVAQALDLPVSTANLHIKVLEDAGLLLTEHRPASRGLQKLCTRAYDQVIVRLPTANAGVPSGDVVEVSMPIGAFVDCAATPSCGLAGGLGIIGMLDDPGSFFDPGRVHAQLIWFERGHLTYRFPNRLPPKATLTSLTVSCELCSEAPLHHDDWPSDITLWINDVEVGTWT